ncbi:VOC family metalloprotein YjdN [Erwinia sp. V71]|uniref:VOC family metalloprotein YjdN n=1 Tax=Erwinia sp. V71 TaxID=3369424 RepID=UPI003F638189
MQLNPYLFLNGNTAEAITFYQQAIDAQTVFQMTFAEMPPQQQQEEGCASAFAFPPDKIMHAELRVGDSQLMLSDGNMASGDQSHHGYAISLASEELDEGKRWFDNLREGGNVTMPWSETFWAQGFGMLTDQFGVHWMVSVMKPVDYEV